MNEFVSLVESTKRRSLDIIEYVESSIQKGFLEIAGIYLHLQTFKKSIKNENLKDLFTLKLPTTMDSI